MTQSTQPASSINALSSSPSPRINHPAEDSAFDLICINLLCNLESLTSEFRQKHIGERIETASITANEILVQLLDFSDEHFKNDRLIAVQEQIRATLERRQEHSKALKKRSWAFALKSLISSKAIDPITVEAYDKLGKSLVYTCGVVFAEMLRQVHSDSQVRSQIDQSSVVFLEELKGVWL